VADFESIFLNAFALVPSRNFYLKINKEKAQDYAFHIPLPIKDAISITLKGQYLFLDHLILLDILSTNNWNHPVYFTSVQEPMQLGLDKYLQLDGYAYKLTPFKSNPKDISAIGIIDTRTLYEQYMNKFSFMSLANPNVYLDWTHVNTISVLSLRTKFARLADALLEEGDSTRAVRVLDKITAMLPHERIPYDHQILPIVELYMKAGEKEKGEQVLRKLNRVATENLTYFQSLPRAKLPSIDYELQVNEYMLHEGERIARECTVAGD
jgi:hypothetical protein